MPQQKNPYDSFDGPSERRQVTPGDPKKPHDVRKAANQAEASQYDPANAATALEIARLNARIKQIEADSAGAQSAAELEQARRPQ